jgi:hypothetical protein
MSGLLARIALAYTAAVANLEQQALKVPDNEQETNQLWRAAAVWYRITAYNWSVNWFD